MKRVIAYCLLLGALLFVPLERMDVGKLEPVQAVWMFREDGKLVLETDTQDRGTGNTVEEALENMKRLSTGIIYLDTAQYLLVTESAQEEISAIGGYLKDRVKVCLWNGEGSVADAAKYLSAHKTGYELERWQPGVKLPNLIMQNKEK